MLDWQIPLWPFKAIFSAFFTVLGMFFITLAVLTGNEEAIATLYEEEAS